MKKYLLLLLSSLFITSSFGTSIVVIVTKKGIVLAADSRSSSDVNGKEEVSKIYKAGNYYYAIGGFVYQDRMFDLGKIVGEALKGNSDFEKAKKEMLTNWCSSIDKVYKLYQMKAPNRYLNDLYIRHSTVYIVTRIKSIPTCLMYKIVVNPDLKTPPQLLLYSLESSSVSVSKDSAFVQEISIGKLDDSDYNLSKANKNPQKAAIEIIEQRIAKDSNMVAKPIDMLFINSRKVKWIQRKKGTPIEM